MKATVSQPESWKKVLSIEVPSEEFQTNVEGKLATYKKKISLPGFREGKVPLAMVKERFGEAIKGEVIEELISNSYKKACEEHNIKPIARGAVSDLKSEEGKPLTFTIEAEIEPEITIKGYKKLKIHSQPKKIKDADVDDAIAELRDRFAEFKDIDRAAKKGDHASIEYARVIVDGKERSDFKNPSYPIEIGKSQFKEIDKALSGSVAGESVEASITFPKDYANGEMAGNNADLTLKVVKVQEKILPELTEEFLKKLGDFTTEEALRERVRHDLEAQETQRAKNEAYGKAIDQLIKDNDFGVPPSMVERYIDSMLEEASSQARPGQPIPAREEFAERYRPAAVHAIKRYRIIDHIARVEKVKASQEEVDAEIKKMAERYKQDFETLKTAFRKNGTTNRIRLDIQEQKVLDYLIGEFAPAVDGAGETKDEDKE